MKKIYFSILCVIIVANLNAQITLTSASSTPQVGDTFDYIITPSPTLNISNGGANQTWDFSSATGASSAFSYIPLSSSLEPATYPLANIVESASGAENYYASSTSKYTIEGQLMPGVIRAIYTDSREFLKFPITYNDVFNETFSGTVENIAAGQTFIRSGTIEIKADGYGTLILPYCTVNDVLRIITVSNYIDNYNGTPIASYLDTIYTWYNATTNTCIANKTVIYVNGVLSLSQATHIEQSSFINGINDLQIANDQISFYPNPAHNYITIKNSDNIISINIHNIKGKLVKTANIHNGTQQISISDLNPGIYFINYTTKSYNYTKKLIVE